MLHIHLFGYLRLLVDGKVYRFQGLPKTTSLLAYLLLNRDTAVSREHLAFLLWDDVSEEEARANLRRHLHDLNRRLPAGEDWLLRDMKTVQWNPAVSVWLDIAEFELLSKNENRLTEAVALYTGDLLQTSYDDWISAERDRFRSLFLTTITGLMAREWERGDLHQAIVYARQLLSQDPLREDVMRDYMRLRHAIGDRAGAMQLYQQFKERLAEELGVEPMRETAELYRELSTQRATVQKPTAEMPKAILEEHLPGKSGVSISHNLPARLTSFVGRHEELANICHMIGSPDSQVRLLTITGTGGTGKTRLSLEVANWLYTNQAESFPDGIYFVALATLTSPDRVPAAIFETLSLKGNPKLGGLDNLKEQLREKRLLLVLDNFEHLVDQSELLAYLLTAVPGLRLLVTSQVALYLYGEHEYPLLPLPLPQADKLPPPAELLDNASVHLFIDRLQAVQPQFRLTTENSFEVTEICRCLDGMPLALELAAARGNRFSPAAMLAQLNRRLSFLTSQIRNLPNRHQTLRATIDWSYSLLTSDEQVLFAGAAMFAGHFTAEAAQAIFGKTNVSSFDDQAQSIPAEDVPELLFALADRGMLRVLQVENIETPTFRMLQTLREYGLEKMKGLETADFYQEQYNNYYFDLAARGGAGLQGPEQSFWIQKIKQENDNIIVALDWLAERHKATQYAVQYGGMVIALARLWIINGWVKEIIRRLELAGTTLAYLPLDLQVKLLNELGNALQVSGDFNTAESYHQEALKIARETGEMPLIAHSLHFLAYGAGWKGHYEEAKVLFQECLPLYRQLPEVLPIQLTRLLNNLAIVHKRMGEFEEAIDLLKECLDLKRKIDDEHGLPASLANLGNLLILQGDYDAASHLIYEALERRRKLQDRQGMLNSINQMAGLAVMVEHYGRAARLYGAADRLHQEMVLSRATDSESDIQRDLETIRQHLGSEEFEARLAEGREWSLEKACEYALTVKQIASFV